MFYGEYDPDAWGSVTIVFTFTRLIWYAQMEGKKFVHKTEEEIHMKKGKVDFYENTVPGIGRLI